MLWNTKLKLQEERGAAVELPTVQLLFDDQYIATAIQCVRKAKSSISICAYAWRWYENAPEKQIQKFNYEVASAVKRGVFVRAILDQRTQASLLKGYGITSKVYPTDKAMHTKAILCDESMLLIGSHNLTERGTAENYEISVALSDPTACLLFNDYFNKMWDNYAVN